MSRGGLINKQPSKVARIRTLGIAFSLCLASSLAHSQTDPALVQALQQETHDRSSNTTDLDSLVWLSEMSSKLERRIPNAFYRVRLLSTIYREARAEGLDPQLVLAVIDIESNFDRNALSHAGAQGLMQVMPFWKQEIGHPNDDLFHPLTSIRYGCKILRHYLDRHPNATDALAAYNGSLGRSTYPNKVFKRLKKQWRYQVDSLNNGEAGDLKIAVREKPANGGKLILN